MLEHRPVYSMIPAFYCCVLLLFCPALAAQESEQNAARRAVQTGQALPFPAVRERVDRYCACEILEAKLHEEEQGGQHFLIYKMKLIKPGGQILKLEMNAATGEILTVKSKGFAH